ncbi:hypothetical protein COV19_03555 [Candidatus Woesearchaeota archaeon CG10_big_fil_rev_8_21_14_0_10_44_13]|nr:MAG: hypothetical protein COV19_03555 [Candidatus Woesearchaeota archaeon CG10_big_fil_rev_8_21_14_0_10_44_13]
MNDNEKKMLDECLGQKWYAQSCPIYPFFISAAATSGFYMKRFVGFGYTKYLYVFKDGYGSMNYFEEDLVRLGGIIEKKVEKDPKYFQKLKRRYDAQMKRYLRFYSKMDKKRVEGLNDYELVKLAKYVSEGLSIAVGIGHVIEPFALKTDVKIKEELKRYVKDEKGLNNIFTLLMSPVKKSFVNEEEEHLWLISKEKDEKKREKLIQQHIKKFFWIRNNYTGRQAMTREDITDSIKTLKNNKTDFRKILDDKNRAIKELGLEKGLIVKIKATEFLIHWQDERKKNILIAIEHIDRMLEALGLRFGIRHDLLKNAIPPEISIENMKSKKYVKMLEERMKGGLYLQTADTSTVATGDYYMDFAARFNRTKESDIREINGMTASSGTAIGRVQICTNLESISQFKEGNVLVASMTRPEYVLAMKKAVAIITDEGGITCHAAIVSRELGIPCIIGTKIATKILHDGDLVEIKGNHGLIIILEKAKSGGKG